MHSLVLVSLDLFYFLLLKNLSSFGFHTLQVFFLPLSVWPFSVASQTLFTVFLNRWWSTPTWYPWTSFPPLLTLDSPWVIPASLWLWQRPRWWQSPTSTSSLALFPEIQICMLLCLPGLSTPMPYRHLNLNISKIKHILSPPNLWHHFPHNCPAH